MKNLFQSLSKILLRKRVHENSWKQLKSYHFDDIIIDLYPKKTTGSLYITS